MKKTFIVEDSDCIEELSFLTYVNAQGLRTSIWNLDQWLRSEIKHYDHDEYQPVRDMLWEFLGENDVAGLIS